MIPETKYAKSGEVHIAYQVFGKGPVDLVVVPGWVSHIEYAWEEPMFAAGLERLASFSRIIWFDKRGTGLSDRVSEMPTLEQRMDDIRAVIDAVGVERVALFGISEGGSMCALFAATYPQKTSALVLYGAFAKRLWSPDYPWAPTLEERQKWINSLEQGWGSDVELESLAPSLANNERFKRWFVTYERMSASPGAAVALAKMNTYIDIRHILPSIHVPTLILHRRGDRDVRVENGRYLAQNIVGAKLVEFEGDDHWPFAGDYDSILNEVQEFLTGTRPPAKVDRMLATILFTDVVGSTKKISEEGDRSWRLLLKKHNEIIRKELARFQGREVKTVGDGFLATFDGPARAVRCACSIRDELRSIGISIRAGLHTGECEILESNDIGGMSVHIASRIASKANPEEILVSSTVKDLVSGSGISFKDRGYHSLKGIPQKWHLFEASA
jgi:class 3 adenylate cyclase/pimeloyl-ACP methyl ester carboxylesterase